MSTENQKIVKDEYVLKIIQKQKFNPNGVKVIDENADPMILLQTASQKMFFSAPIAQNLMKDIAILLAGIKKPEVKEEKKDPKNK